MVRIRENTTQNQIPVIKNQLRSPNIQRIVLHIIYSIGAKEFCFPVIALYLMLETGIFIKRNDCNYINRTCLCHRIITYKLACAYLNRRVERHFCPVLEGVNTHASFCVTFRSSAVDVLKSGIRNSWLHNFKDRFYVFFGSDLWLFCYFENTVLTKINGSVSNPRTKI